MTLRRRPTLALALVLLLGLAGCADYRLVVPEPNPATEVERVTMHAFLWGFVGDTQPAHNCVANALDEVRVRTHYGYALVSVLTLGLWMPLDVEWRCGKPPLDAGEI
jgi:hypothetical protein